MLFGNCELDVTEGVFDAKPVQGTFNRVQWRKWEYYSIRRDRTNSFF